MLVDTIEKFGIALSGDGMMNVNLNDTIYSLSIIRAKLLLEDLANSIECAERLIGVPIIPKPYQDNVTQSIEERNQWVDDFLKGKGE